jgi:MFS family permease
VLVRLALTLFALQAGFHGFTASLPLALARAGIPDAEIGLIVGAAAVVQVPAAFVGGALIDRFGGIRLLGVGGLAYLVGAAVLLLPGVDPTVDRLPFLVARVSQGIGLALTLPSALSLVPRYIAPERSGFGLAFVGSAHNLTLIALPPLSLAILGENASLDGVALTVVALIGVGMALLASLALARPRSPRPVNVVAADGERSPGPVDPPPAANRHFGIAFRRAWAIPLGVIVLYIAHWGVITAYLPQRAELAGANVGLFFAADGLAVLALRIPSGWLADRVQPRLLIVVGLLGTAVAIGLLVLPPATPILVVAGILTGGGAGVSMTPLLVELSRRSTDADRGGAFAMFTAASATALVLGSVGVAPIVAASGFEAAIGVTIGGLVLAAILAFADRDLAGTRQEGPDVDAELGSAGSAGSSAAGP